MALIVVSMCWNLHVPPCSTKEIKKLTEIPLEECYETGVPYSAIEMCSRWCVFL